MKSASVFLGLVVGMVIGAATGYFNGEAIRIAPGGTFLWVHTFPLALRGQLVLPMLASWCIIVAETIGNVTASCDVSHLDITDESFMSRIQGGMLADSLSATLAGLATVPPLTTFAQNSGVIALTRNASRQSGYMCAFLLLIMGIVGKFGAIFVAAPPSVIGGFSTFLFGNVAASGARILAYAKWTRRDRFIAGTMFAFGFASLCVEDWFSYIFTYQGDNNGIKGLIQAVTLIIEEPYLISALLGVVLNACLPDEIPDEVVNTAEEKREWNQPGPILGETVPTPPPIERRSSEVVLH
jgi:NCS2 family nucleobase:cation symporter-2